MATKHADEEHERDHKEFKRIKKLIKEIVNSKQGEARTKLINKLINKVDELAKHVLEHFKTEEDDMNPIGKKYYSLQQQKQIIRQVWEVTTFENWNIFIPFIVMNLPYPGQRVRFLRCLRWVSLLFNIQLT